jgi:two-component system sensor histidine kinase/response regulator
VGATGAAKGHAMSDETPLVLVIDDEEAMRDACSQILLKAGYRVETAKDGETGIRLIKSLRPALVIVDLKMPGMSGFEILESLPAIDPLIVAVVITGYATVDSAVEAMKKGAHDFLPKPFTPEALRIIIARGLDRRRLVLEAEALRKEKRLLQENFVTMVSHQLRSPLVAIQQEFEILLAGLAGPVDDRVKGMIGKANERLGGLVRLINDWLDLARLERGRFVGTFERLDVRKILDRTIGAMAPSARASGISLEWAGAAGPALEVLADGQGLEQVFSNLLHNAIRYNKPQGRVRVDLREEPEAILVEITDTGIGISPEHLPLIFDQFFRVARPGDTAPKGSGLGLSIAKKLVEAHHGRIDVRSEPGVGTSFTVRLPKAAAGGAAPEGAPA